MRTEAVGSGKTLIGCGSKAAGGVGEKSGAAAALPLGEGWRGVIGCALSTSTAASCPGRNPRQLREEVSPFLAGFV